MNLIKCKKNGLSPEELNVDLFNMHRIEKTQKIHCRKDDYDVKRYSTKRKKLREEPFLGEKVFILAERIKKKAVPGKFYKQSVQNIRYLNEDRTFIITTD